MKFKCEWVSVFLIFSVKGGKLDLYGRMWDHTYHIEGAQ